MPWASNNRFCESVASVTGSRLRRSRAHRSDSIVSISGAVRQRHSGLLGGSGKRSHRQLSLSGPSKDGAIMNSPTKRTGEGEIEDLDGIIVGAGFAGLYLLDR